MIDIVYYYNDHKFQIMIDVVLYNDHNKFEIMIDIVFTNQFHVLFSGVNFFSGDLPTHFPSGETLKIHQSTRGQL